MSSGTCTAPRRRARRIPVYRTIAGFARDPLRAFEDVGRKSRGEIVRLDLGLFRPYLLTRPEHVQHVLRDHAARYLRDGMMWRPLRRLLGNGLAGEGPMWAAHRKLFQPLFSAKNIDTFVDTMAEAIARAVDDLAASAREEHPVDVLAEMTRIVHRAFSSVFFGGRLTTQDTDRLGDAVASALTSLNSRMLLPFVPEAVPLPGDGAYRRAGQIVDEVLLPLIRQSRDRATESGNDDGDIVSILCRERDGLDDQAVRNDVVALFAAGTESTALTLTWLWVVLDAHPAVAAKLYDEVDTVVGTDRPGQRHLAELRYTKMVLQELLRLYPAGWIIPRTAGQADVVDDIMIAPGSTVLISPYLTHRMDRLWERADRFDPERFSPDRAQRRHRFAYFPFGGGGHQCLGSHLFTVEAQLIIATILGRYRPVLCGSAPARPQAGASLRPDRRVQMILRPNGSP